MYYSTCIYTIRPAIRPAIEPFNILELTAPSTTQQPNRHLFSLVVVIAGSNNDGYDGDAGFVE
jgi:hypothetical protein